MSRTIVIKLGTSSIVHELTHQPLLSTLSSVVETVVHLRKKGHKVVLVSSGAIGVGLRRMNMGKDRPKGLAGKQALAAIGQGRLIALYDELFGHLEQPIAQVLLTRGDISDRTRYLNAVNTLNELLSMGVVPIVNENDTISVSEIKFGDNDTLSAITSSMIHADYLFLLTDVDGLYTGNPRKDPHVKKIDVVHEAELARIRERVSTSSLGSSLGTGGMETKIIAAEIATGAGVTTIITSSKSPGPESIWGIVEWVEWFKANEAMTDVPTESSSALPSTPTLLPSNPSSLPLSSSSLGQSLPPPRPSHTLFLPSPSPLPDLKSWTTHTLFPSGSVIIDSGAHRVLFKRESGGRLLAVGVRGVIGRFASGQAVRIVVFKHGRGSESSSSSSSVAPHLASGSAASTPSFSTPALSRSTSFGDLDRAADMGTGSGTGVGVGAGEQLYTDDDVVEVGRGLAMYNYAQIERVRGLNSSHLAQVLGYADSEYVVENVTVRVPPKPDSEEDGDGDRDVGREKRKGEENVGHTM